VQTHSLVRRAATALAFIALILLGVRPSRTVTVRPADAVLVTPGASDAAVRRLADSIGVERVLRLTGRDSLPDAGYIARHYGDARGLHVVGWGLVEAEWRALGTAPASVHAAPVPPGFQTATWPERVVLGDEIRVAGAFGTKAGTRVLLSDASGPLDSTTTRSDGTFTLRTRPSAVGRQRLHLSASTAAETLGVLVTPPPQRRALILTAAPSFEASALRDLLGKAGSSVAWRAGLSRGRNRAEFVNRPRTALDQIGDRVLSQQDIVIADGRALEALSDGERAALLRAIADSGVGLILIADDRGAAARRFGFSLVADTAMAERLVRPRTAGGRPAGSPVPAMPYALRPVFGVGAVLWGASGDVLAQVMPRGAGRIVVTLVAAPSRWLRSGERTQFAAYWTALLGAAAGTRHGDRWTVSGGRVHEPIRIVVRAAGRPAGQAVVRVIAPSGARDSLYLTRDAIDPTRWSAQYWPREVGWHEIEGANEAAFLVTSATAWAAQRAAERLAATAHWSAIAPPAPAAGPPGRQQKPLPLTWWLALFVLAAGVLWADRRRAYIRAMPTPRNAVVAVLLLTFVGCSKSEEDKRAEVNRCAEVNTSAELIAVCLSADHKWKDREADSAGRRKAQELDSARAAQEQTLWDRDAARHTAELRECAKGSDMRECLLVRFGWGTERATRTADSVWQRNSAQHAREVRSCERGRNPVASCLMLNYKWNAQRAFAAEDSLRRAHLR
jgi:hypothetical protein